MENIKLDFSKPQKPKDTRTFWNFIWTLWDAYKFKRDIENYCWARYLQNCQIERIPQVSKETRILYGIKNDSQEAVVWGIVDAYFKGVSAPLIKEEKNTNGK